ncbi:ribonuclease III domain-containing protein [Candidatus Odyssella acanthamoebae]|uniref:ribonuclease III domain-containing protein n=1 Tax=Candidatus Odyssella acanthamoebae TaxID=91604 RepID=UPI001E428E4A|nr:ribonuclease III domain-containing protein [Candidatus Paracaedibacter acanthamoebae]
MQKHLGYQFNDETLLQEALYPLLPKILRKEEEKYNHLEFLGDSVLGAAIREYLVKRFPEQKRGFLDAVYKVLTKNKTLTEVYLQQLSIEAYLPFPETEKCEYCNVVEALIGAIHLDGGEKGYRNAKTFVMTILNDHVIQEKISIIASEKSIMLGINLLPEIKKHLAEVSRDQPIEKINPKSFLGEVLLKTWSVAPEYTLSLTINNQGDPLLEARISGIQIGKKQIKGVGYTVREAEENAARNTINFISQQPIFPTIDPIFSKTYTALLNEWSTIKKITGLKILDSTLVYPTIFKYQATLRNGILIEGEGGTKRIAKEEAAKQAYHQLTNSQSTVGSSSKNYRTLLREWFDKNPDSIFEFEEHIIQPDPLYTIQILIGQEIISEKNGINKASDIREAACRDALIYLIRQQEAREKEIESRKVAGKPADKKIPDGQTSIKTESASVQPSKAPKKSAAKMKANSQPSKTPTTTKSVSASKKKQATKESSVMKKSLVPNTGKGE